MFQLETSGVSTKRASLRLIKVPNSKTKMERNSIRHRASLPFNLLKIQSLLPEGETNASMRQVFDIYHLLKDSYILANDELVRKIF